MNQLDGQLDVSSPQYSGAHREWNKVVKIWKERPGLGPAQIKNQMGRDGIKISVSTVRNILLENGYVPPKAVTKKTDAKRYEAARPREIVHHKFESRE